MDYNQFAESIKTKYPQYKEVDNLTLSKKMVEKYPAYASKVTFNEQKKQSFGESLKSIDTNPATKFIQKNFAGEKVGKSIGTLAGYLSSKNKEFYDTSAPTPTQVGGDILAGAAQVVGAKIPSATTIAGKGAQLGALGAAAAGGTATAEGKPLDDVFKSALLGGTIGFGLGAGTGAIGKGVTGLTKKAPANIYNTAIKSNLQDNKIAIKYGGKTLGEELIDRGIKGGDKKLLATAQKGLQNSEDKLQSILSKSDKTITRKELSGYLDDLISQKQSTPGLADEVDKLRNVLNEVPENMSIAQANQIKRNLYNALGDVKFKLDPTLSTKQEAMKAIAKGIKTEIENKTAGEVGEDVVRNINKDLSVYGKLQDRIVDKLARANRNNLFQLGDFGLGGVGAIVGAATGGAGAVGGALAGAAVNRAAKSTRIATNVAVRLSGLGKLIDRLPTDGAGRISKAALVNLLSKIGQTNRQ